MTTLMTFILFILIFGVGVISHEFGHYLLAKANGIPEGRERLSSNFKKAIQHMDMPHIRFHDLRHPNVKPRTQTFLACQNFFLQIVSAMASYSVRDQFHQNIFL